MALIYVIFVLLYITSSFGNRSDDKFEDCMKIHTLGYGYKKMYHILEVGGHHNETGLMFTFFVKAESDAHILLSPMLSPGNTDYIYEVIIGAGKNTFSAIRRQLGKSGKTNIQTPGILSQDEYRGFWIDLSRDGLLQVGKENDTAPFMFWKDPLPLHINYFSFCNWRSIVGKWAFSCPNETQSEAVEEKLSTEEKLRRNVLHSYDPYIRPVLNETDIIKINIRIQNYYIKIDEKQSTMSVVADFHMQWTDQKAQWNPNDYDNITKLVVTLSDIWAPSFFVHNALGSPLNLLPDTTMFVTYYGNVTAQFQMHIGVLCDLDLSQWPYDINVCIIQLSALAEQPYIQFQADIKMFEQMTHSEWKLLDLQARNIYVPTPILNNSNTQEKALGIYYYLQRNNNAYQSIFGVPLLVITILTLLPFWLSPLHSGKLLVSCLCLIIIVVFVICLARILPAPADHVPKLVQTYTNGMLAITFSILTSILVINITRSTHTYPVPMLIQSVLSYKYLQMTLFISFHHSDSEYGMLAETANITSEITIPLTKNEIQKWWILLGKVIDRLAFIMYTIYVCTVFLTEV